MPDPPADKFHRHPSKVIVGQSFIARRENEVERKNEAWESQCVERRWPKEAGEIRESQFRIRDIRESPGGARTRIAYAELHCLTNFSFLRGASHPEELVERAGELGYEALAITDRNSLAGVVRAHAAAKHYNRAHPDRPLRLIIGAEITPIDAPPIVLLATDRGSYGRLCRLITRGRLRSVKGDCRIELSDVAELSEGLIGIVEEWREGRWCDRKIDEERSDGATRRGSEGKSSDVALSAGLTVYPPGIYRSVFPSGNLYLAAVVDHVEADEVRLARLAALGREAGVPLAATNRVHYHDAWRRYLQDVLTCIREKCTLAKAGSRLLPNADRHLRPLEEIERRYGAAVDDGVRREARKAVARTSEIAARCTFSLDELRYEYPRELVPSGRTPMEHLEELTWASASKRYGTVPEEVKRLLERELRLIREVGYEHYFLTVHDLVTFARSRGILCQGRGSAANSAVCYCLGITAVDPTRHDLLFERFISRERNEPPDIDVDFEHERREEVFQYIYGKYGRDRAAITAEVITYRPRSAVRDVGKALGLSLDRVDAIAKSIDWFSRDAIPGEALRGAGLDPADRTVQMLVRLVKQLLGFPRHLSQHVGGFVITESPLCEIVPVENGAKLERTFIEWDKDDIDELGILKVDCLALGMLTAINKCFSLIQDGAQHDGIERPRDLAAIPSEDPAVYDMICRADTVGVFQIESRAQMSMLPRLRPRKFYDLVIEVALVRPGPIQGGMVHPYLKRRHGLEPVTYPSAAVQEVLEKTLGVPLFQEQVMRLAVVAAGFTPGEADQLRRAMGAWRKNGEIQKFQTKLMAGLLANGYKEEFAESLYKQIAGFGEYGFPESHSASFSLLVYASAWLKCYHPAAFCASLINSQPMGFYTPSQLIQDVARHGVRVLPVDVSASEWDCTLESPVETCEAGKPAIRLGFRLVRGLSAAKVGGIIAQRRRGDRADPFSLVRRRDVSRDTLLRLAAADAFRSLGLSRREALWEILALEDEALALYQEAGPDDEKVTLPAEPVNEMLVHDYDATGLTLNGHPMELVRDELQALNVARSDALAKAPRGRRIRVAGMVTCRQHPSTAKGTVFLTLEDEAGNTNLIVRPRVWERYGSVGRAKSALIAEGVVERQGDVVHVMVSRLWDLSADLIAVRTKPRDFR